MSQCQGISVLDDETYTVVVRFPKKPFSTRISETWTAYRVPCMYSVVLFLLSTLLGVAMIKLREWVYCHQQPGMGLETLSIRNMTAYQTNSTGTTQWKVDSAFNIGLKTWNPNSGCSKTYRSVLVRVEYKSQTILQQEVPLGFRLQPQTIWSVTMNVEGKDFLLEKSGLGPVMEAEIRSGNVTLDVYFNTRYDRKARWVNYGCLVVATSPSNSSSSLLKQDCD